MADEPKIPEDIVATATGLCVEWAKSSEGSNYLMAAIAIAIWSERERCAACCHTTLGREDFVMMGSAGVARQIENAIRLPLASSSIEDDDAEEAQAEILPR